VTVCDRLRLFGCTARSGEGLPSGILGLVQAAELADLDAMLDAAARRAAGERRYAATGCNPFCRP